VTSFAAIPARFAIGNRQSSIFQGYVPEGGQYRLYVSEIAGQPLAVAVTLIDSAGALRGDKRIFLGPREPAIVDVSSMFQGLSGSAVRIEGLNGNGKIVALGWQRSTGMQDASVFEMSFPAPPRFSVSWTEGLAYVAVAMAVIAAVIARAIGRARDSEREPSRTA
jgi:hypothetical protein